MDWALSPITGTRDGCPALTDNKFCFIGLAPRTSTAKPTAHIARCALVLRNANFLALTASNILLPATTAHHTLTGRATAALRFYRMGPIFVQGRRPWWLGSISARTATDREYFVRFLDDPKPIKLSLSPASYMTWTGAVQASGCLRILRLISVVRGIYSNVDESRGTEVVS